MTKRERLILQIIFMEKGLNPTAAHYLINNLETKEISYDKVLTSLPQLNNIIYYFQEKNYRPLTISGILELSITNDIKPEAIIKKDETFLCNNYSIQETEKIERIYPKVLELNSVETLDKKLTLYNDADVKEDILYKPRRLKQSLNISYSRFKMLSERNVSLKQGNLFMTECQFKDNFGYWNNELLEKYPIEGTKYCVKK